MFYSWPSIVFLCFSKPFPNGEYVNSACFIICLCLEGNIYSPVRYLSIYSYLSIFPGDNADTFAASLLISDCNFSSLIISSVIIISFYVLSERFFLNKKGLSNPRITSITKNEYGFSVNSL